MWAFSEAFLGGILHAFHVPFAGLLLSSFAVMCMVALTLHGHTKGQLLKATLLVIMLKAILSPHTPVSAYFAVLLQGLFGEIFFFLGLPFFLSCLLLGIASLLQSSFQKLIILTLLFGVDFWEAMNEFLNSINKMMGAGDFNYSFYLVSIYIGLHFCAGIIVGIFCSRLPHYLSSSSLEFKSNEMNIPQTDFIFPNKNYKRSKFTKPIYWILLLLLIYALYQAYSESSILLLVKSKAMRLIVRSTLFLLLWYFFISPLLLIIFQKWLAKQKSKFTGEVESLIKLIPEMKFIVEKCWMETKGNFGFKRIGKFIRFTFYMILKKDANTFGERGNS